MEGKLNEQNVQDEQRNAQSDIDQQQNIAGGMPGMVNNVISPYGLSSYYVASYPPLVPQLLQMPTSEPMRFFPLLRQIPMQSAPQLPPEPPLFAVTSNTFHPAQDPSELLRRFIRQNSPDSDENPEFYRIPNDSTDFSRRTEFFTSNQDNSKMSSEDQHASFQNQNQSASHHMLKPAEKSQKKKNKGANKKQNKNTKVYFVQFKYFCKEYVLGYGAPGTLKVGDKVIVATERGDDLGTIVEIMSLDEFYRKRHLYNTTAENNASGFIWTSNSSTSGTDKSHPLLSQLTKSNSTESYNSNISDNLSDTNSHQDNGSSDDSSETFDTLLQSENNSQKQQNDATMKRSVDLSDPNDQSVVPNSSMFVRSLGRLLRLASDFELEKLQQKTTEEINVVKYVQSLIDNSYHFKMHVNDAEYQLNMNKLTIYYTTDDMKRIDFRDMEPMLPVKFQSFDLYQSRNAIYLVGIDTKLNEHSILEIVRPHQFFDNDKLIWKLYSSYFDSKQVIDFMKKNKAIEVFTSITCIYGAIKLLNSYYLVVVTKSEVAANLNGHEIFVIKETEMMPIAYKVRVTVDETRYKNLLSSYSLTNNDFYFSYTYNLTQSMQNNTLIESSNMSSNCGANNTEILHQKAEEVDGNSIFSQEKANFYQNNTPIQERFVWNLFALQPFLSLQHRVVATDINRVASTQPTIDRFIVPIIHGYVRQSSVSISPLETLKMTLIARRSSYFAGTRYLRRGCNNMGDVANEVESEQIVTVETKTDWAAMTEDLDSLFDIKYRNASSVQVRGSIPLYWSHTNMFMPAPDIILEPIDLAANKVLTAGINTSTLIQPNIADNTNNNSSGNNSDNQAIQHAHNLNTALLHYTDLYNRYSGTIYTLNLIKQQGAKREEYIGQHFEKVCNELESCEVYNGNSGNISGSSSISENNTITNNKSDMNNADGGFLTGNNTGINDKSSNSNSNKLVKYFAFDLLTAVHNYEIQQKQLQLNSYNVEGIIGNAKHDDIFATLSNIAANILPYSAFFVYINSNTHTHNNNNTHNNSTSDSNSNENSKNNSNKGTIKQLQCGVLRTNCIDCLDRTNIAQFTYSKTALFYQLKALGVIVESKKWNDIQIRCMELWSEHGDVLANQYGGSGAMHKLGVLQNQRNITTNATTESSSEENDTEKSDVNGDNDSISSDAQELQFTLVGGPQNAVVAVQRYYSNITTDYERQQSIDLLLGIYRPGEIGTTQLPLWEIEQHPSLFRTSHREIAGEKEYLRLLSASYELYYADNSTQCNKTNEQNGNVSSSDSSSSSGDSNGQDKVDLFAELRHIKQYINPLSQQTPLPQLPLSQPPTAVAPTDADIYKLNIRNSTNLPVLDSSDEPEEIDGLKSNIDYINQRNWQISEKKRSQNNVSLLSFSVLTRDGDDDSSYCDANVLTTPDQVDQQHDNIYTISSISGDDSSVGVNVVAKSSWFWW